MTDDNEDYSVFFDQSEENDEGGGGRGRRPPPRTSRADGVAIGQPCYQSQREYAIATAEERLQDVRSDIRLQLERRHQLESQRGVVRPREEEQDQSRRVRPRWEVHDDGAPGPSESRPRVEVMESSDDEEEQLARIRSEKAEMNEDPMEEINQLFMADGERPREQLLLRNGEREEEEEQGEVQLPPDPRLMDPDDEEDQMWQDIDRYPCRVCKLMNNDPYMATFVGQLQNEVLKMLENGCTAQDTEIVIHRMVAKNNQHLIRPMRNAGLAVEAVSATDFMKHFAVGPYNTQNPCQIVRTLEMKNSISSARVQESLLLRNLAQDTEGMQTCDEAYQKKMRAMFQAGMAKARLLQIEQSLTLKSMQIEILERKEHLGRAKSGRIFENQTTLIKPQSSLGGVSVQQLSGTGSVNCSSVFSLLQQGM